MKLSDIKGEAVFECAAALIEPVATIAADEKCAALFRGKRAEGEDNKAFALRRLRESLPYLLKTYSKELIAILAALEGKAPEEYAKTVTLLTLPGLALELMDDEALIGFFTSAAQRTEKAQPAAQSAS